METSQRQLDKAQSYTFIKAGNSLVTFKSLKTGKHLTYRIKKAKTKDVWFVSVLYNPSNKAYTYMGIISDEDMFIHTQGSRVKIDCMSFQAFKWAWDFIKINEIHKMLEVWHEGRCGKCGKVLTDPESIKKGYGPTCWKFI